MQSSSNRPWILRLTVVQFSGSMHPDYEISNTQADGQSLSCAQKTLMIKKSIFFGTILFLWHLQAIASNQYIPGDIEKLLVLPENQIDVGMVALTLAKEVYSNLDVAAYSRKIDVLADKVKQLANGTRDPEQRIRVLNTVLFRMEGFHYDRDPFSRSKQEYRYLNGVLDTKQGICYSLPLLYVAVAQRVGYPVYPVQAPDHMFVRYSDPAFKEQNIETTSGGKYFEDEWYIKDFAIGKKGLASGSYMRTLTYREFLGVMLEVNAGFHFDKMIGIKGITYLENARLHNPKHADTYNELGRAYLAMSKVVNAEWAAKFQFSSEQYVKKAKELGYVSQTEISPTEMRSDRRGCGRKMRDRTEYRARILAPGVNA